MSKLFQTALNYVEEIRTLEAAGRTSKVVGMEFKTAQQLAGEVVALLLLCGVVSVDEATSEAEVLTDLQSLFGASS